MQLYREICEQGYDGCRSVVTDYLTQLRYQAGLPIQTGKRGGKRVRQAKVPQGHGRLISPSLYERMYLHPVKYAGGFSFPRNVYQPSSKVVLQELEGSSRVVITDPYLSASEPRR